MSRRPIGTISIGAIITIFGITYALYLAQIIRDTEIIPVILTFSGLWLLILAILRVFSPEKYELGPFSTAWWGSIILFGGILWFLSVREFFTAPTVWAVFAVAFGLFVVVAGIREWMTKSKKT